MTNSHKYKDRQHNDQKTWYKDKTLHRKLLSNANPIKNVGCSGREEIPASLVSDTVTVKRHEHHAIWKSCGTWVWVWNLGEISMVYTFKTLYSEYWGCHLQLVCRLITKRLYLQIIQTIYPLQQVMKKWLNSSNIFC